MAHNLDVALASTAHGNMLLSLRGAPRMTLRKVASYGSLEKGPDSATSSSFTINGLAPSCPPSPGLPFKQHQIHPRSHHRTRSLFRLLVWCAGVVTVLWFAFKQIQANRPLPNAGWSNDDAEAYEMIGEDALPDFPTPLVVTDKRGRAKWTISIPPMEDFPLQPDTYIDICTSSKETSDHVADLHSHRKSTYRAHAEYYHVDPYFMDISEAIDLGMLPKVGRATLKGGPVTPGNEGDIVGEKGENLVEQDVCDMSLTFVMETGNAGFGETLLLLWTAYGLAQKEGRSFFVDDTRWAYGSYSTYFKPPPLPSCRPPPRTEILPCPHHARHLLVSAATAPWTFGGQFNSAFEDVRRPAGQRKDLIYSLARVGYEALFHLEDEDASYLEQRIFELRNKTALANGDQDGMLVGVHVRHGDAHPTNFMYRDAYIPADVYETAAHELLISIAKNMSKAAPAVAASVVILASDDPATYDETEFVTAVRAQEKFILSQTNPVREAHPVLSLHDLMDDTYPHTHDHEATSAAKSQTQKTTLETTANPQSPSWLGGFYAPLFWSLGMGVPGVLTPADLQRSQSSPTNAALILRKEVARTYLLDMAVLAKADGVVCAGGMSISCRVLAVMLGWEDAVLGERWKDVEDELGRGWWGLAY